MSSGDSIVFEWSSTKINKNVYLQNWEYENIFIQRRSNTAKIFTNTIVLLLDIADVTIIIILDIKAMLL